MAILPGEYIESLRRCWRRRKYRRINGASNGRKKLQVLRLGGADLAPRRRLWRIRRIPKLHWKIISPIKLLGKINDAYASMMICLANKMASSNGGFIRGKKVARARQVAWASSGEQVDCRLVEEIYKNLVASRRLSTEMSL